MSMSEKDKDNLFYVCTLIEYIARKTANHRGAVVRVFDKVDLKRQLGLAEVNHCLTFDQVASELIEEYQISNGTFDSVKECKYQVPSVTSIGRVYQQLILSAYQGEDTEQALIDVFSSFISDEISNFNSNIYYSNPDYLKWSYLEGELLD